MEGQTLRNVSVSNKYSNTHSHTRLEQPEPAALLCSTDETLTAATKTRRETEEQQTLADLTDLWFQFHITFIMLFIFVMSVFVLLADWDVNKTFKILLE